MTICVYLGSSGGSREIYRTAVKELGSWIGRNGHDLVYGGSHCGLMGMLADAALENGARVTGVEPRFFVEADLLHPGIDELIVVETMAERRSKMIELSDAFIAFPGGVGTLDEISEIMVMNGLGLMSKPCILYNVDGYYDKLKEFLDHTVREGFFAAERREMIRFVSGCGELDEALANGPGRG